MKRKKPDIKFEDIFECLKVTNVPATFVKTFVYDDAEEIDEIANHYAEDNELEVKSISVCYISFSNVFSATVVFGRGCENG